MSSLMRSIHIYSAMFVLALMFFFSITGFLLNHPELDSRNQQKPELKLKAPKWASQVSDWSQKTSYHGLLLMQWLDKNYQIRGTDFNIEWDDIDKILLIQIQSPRNNVFVELNPDNNSIAVQVSQFSFLSTLNNIHRAKHTSGIWGYLSDFSAIAMLIFCLSGVWLLAVNRLQRISGTYWFTAGTGIFIYIVYLMH